MRQPFCDFRDFRVTLSLSVRQPFCCFRYFCGTFLGLVFFIHIHFLLDCFANEADAGTKLTWLFEGFSTCLNDTHFSGIKNNLCNYQIFSALQSTVDHVVIE